MAGLINFESEPTSMATETSQSLLTLNGNTNGNGYHAANGVRAAARSSTAADTGPAVAEGADASALAHVLAIGTTNPERIVPQSDFPDIFINAVQGYATDPRIPDFTRKITQHSGITTRHLAITPDEYLNKPNMLTYNAPSLNDRQRLWEGEGIKLGAAAAEKALVEWGRDRALITHLVTFSTSGMLCPGIDLRLIKALGLPQSTKHMFVSYMGCHAGLIGLRLAAEIALADPGKHRVMVVAAEVNSVNAQVPEPGNPINNIIVDVIFGDGAAAIVLGVEPTAEEKPIYEVHRIGTSYIPDTDEAITARLTHQGLDVGLARNVPQLVSGSVDPFVRSIVGDMDYNSLLWAVHPGGKAIVDAVEKGCRLPPGTLQVSREVLDQFSNMASCTVLFVLDKVRRDNAGAQRDPSKKYTLALAFGPGISVEGALLKLVQ